jgi:hypothetical protein
MKMPGHEENKPPRRIYFDVCRADDELLKDVITEEHNIKSSDFVEAVAKTYGVRPADIAFPTPYLVRELAEAAAYVEAAKKRSMQNAAGDYEGADSFELKRRVYQSQIDRILKMITAADFLGDAGKRPGMSTITLWRN